MPSKTYKIYLFFATSYLEYNNYSKIEKRGQRKFYASEVLSM